MISAQELAGGILGAWRLAHFDRSGARYFDATLDGFWKSFTAALIVFPAEAVLRALFLVSSETETLAAGALRIGAVFVIAYVIQWVLFPLLMIRIADFLGRPQNYIGFIVAHNWAAVIQMAIILPAGTLFAMTGIGTPGWGAAVFFAAILATWVYGWYVAKAMLDIPGMAAAFVLLTEIFIGIGLAWVSDALLATEPSPA